MENKLTQKEINKIIENHKHWLNADVDGWDNMKANFSNKDLRDADLSDANLCDANLSDANLCDANLSYANLSNADLRDANLRGANLSGAYLLGVKNMMYIPMACPEEGSFIGFKRAEYADKEYVE